MNREESLTDLLAAHCTLLRERLQYFVDDLPLPLRNDVVQAFKEPGKLFTLQDNQSSSVHPGRWALITFLVAQGINPDINPRLAGDVAIAVEIFMCGLDLIDDVEDGDQTTIVRTIGPARVLNVAIALLMLAQKVHLSLLDEAIDPSIILSLLDTLVIAFLKSVNGQHLDILLENVPFADINGKDSINMIDLKSGSLMSVTMQLGALCAGAEKEICDQFAECGRLLGIAYQLDNDSHDLYDLMHKVEQSATQGSPQKSMKTDLIREKKTFPMVIASQQGNTLQMNEAEEKAVQEGIVASWGVSLLYRERALEVLQDLEKRNLVSPLLRHVLHF